MNRQGDYMGDPSRPIAHYNISEINPIVIRVIGWFFMFMMVLTGILVFPFLQSLTSTGEAVFCIGLLVAVGAWPVYRLQQLLKHRLHSLQITIYQEGFIVKETGRLTPMTFDTAIYIYGENFSTDYHPTEWNPPSLAISYHLKTDYGSWETTNPTARNAFNQLGKVVVNLYYDSTKKQLRNGETLQFNLIKLSQAGLTCPPLAFRWDQIKQISFYGYEMMRIEQPRLAKIHEVARLAEIPNVHLLMRLLADYAVVLDLEGQRLAPPTRPH